MYRCSPDKAIRDIYVVTGKLARRKAGWRDGECYGGSIRKLSALEAPLFLEDFKLHRILKTAGFVRRNFQGNCLVSEYWPYIHDMIVTRNPSMEKILREYSPEKI
jgi:hypothetical protein